MSKSSLRERLAHALVQLNSSAEELFADARFQTADQASLVHVLAVSVSSLGFPAGAIFTQLAGAAYGQGLSLCPLELGPHLRLQYPEQPESDDEADTTGKAPPGSITVASVPPPDEDATPWGFYLRRIGGHSWLRGYRCWSGHVWAPEDILVFVRSTDAP